MLYHALNWALLVGAAFLAGAVNTMAGGGTLLTFPSLQAFGRLDELTANGTSTAALMPGSLAGAWGLRGELVGPLRRWFWLLLPPSLVGGLVGGLLATGFDNRYFAAVIPWLLLGASLLFLLQPALSRLARPAVAEATHKEWEGGRKEPEGLELPSGWALVGILVFQFLVAVYGGYFGAGIGVLMLSSLGLMGVGDINQMNAIKTLLAAVINLMSIVVWVAAGKIDWLLAAPMTAGAIAGGYFGAVLGKMLPKWVVRWFVIAVGLALSAWYFAKPWLVAVQ